jgi:hypothetical protein
MTANNASQDYRVIRGETVSLQADRNVLAEIERLVREGVQAFPKRGLEVGGILTGSLGSEIRLSGVRPLPMEYRTGPVFRPSAADLLFVKQSVEAAGPSLIGHFRSQTAAKAEPTEMDNAIAALLQVTGPLLLLVPASPGGIEETRLYGRVKGQWLPLLRFQLAEKPPQPLTVPVHPPFGSVLPSSSARGGWALGGLAVGLACGLFLSHMLWPSRQAYTLTTAPAHSGLGLQVHPDGGLLKVQWNSLTPVVVEAVSGVVSVQDGKHRLQIPLDRKQLQTGSTLYAPESGWVEIKLDLYSDEKHYSGEAVSIATGLQVSNPKTGTSKAEPPATAAPARQNK